MRNKNNSNRSAVISALDRFSAYFYKKLPESFVANLFTKKHFGQKNGLFSKLFDKIGFKRRISIPFKRFLAKNTDNSFILSGFKRIIKLIPLIQIKCIGLFYFAFGLSAALTYLLQISLSSNNPSQTILIVAAMCCLSGGILSGSQKNCYRALSESRILSTLMFKLLGLNRNDVLINATGIGKGGAFFVCGLLFGIIGSFTSVVFTALLFPALICLYSMFAFPESGAVSLFLVIPFLTSYQLSVICAIIFFAWILKLLRGKRILHLASIDICVLLFAVTVLFGGIVSVSPKASMSLALTYLSMLGAYFATVNLMRTPEWIKRCAAALSVSFGISLTAGVLGQLVELIPSNRAGIFDEIMSQELLTLFSFNPMLIYMAVATLPIILLKTGMKHESPAKVIIFLTVIASIACFIFGRSRSGLISALIGMVILLLLVSKRSFTFLVPAAIVLPALISVLPSSVISFITGFITSERFSSSYRHGVTKTIERILCDSFAGGIGLGDKAFEKIYPLYANTSSQGIPKISGLYTHITVSLGITGLIIFAVFIIALLRMYFRYYAESNGECSSLKATATASFTGICSLLVMGLVDHIWSRPPSFMLFWLLVALLTSCIKTFENERYARPLDGPALEIDCNSLNCNSKRKDHVL